MIETLDDIIEDLANQAGVYGADRRSCWVATVKGRIEAAVEIESRLTALAAVLRSEAEK
jgi:hypothetical protein